MIRLEHDSPQVAEWRRQTLDAMRRRREVVGRHLDTEDAAAARAEQSVASVDLSGGDRVWADGDTWVWVRLDPDHGTARLCVATGPFDSAALVEALRSESVTSLLFARVAGDTSLDDLVDAGALVATRMEIGVDGVPEPVGVRLAPMTGEQIEAFLSTVVDSYAQDLLGSGAFPDPEAARAEARRQHENLFPGGRPKDEARLWSACAATTEGSDGAQGERPVGILWIELGAERGFVYDIEVDESARGRGYGTQILRAAAAEVRAAGLPVLGLNVFGQNDGARRLYLREGYRVTEEHFQVAVPR